MGRVLHKQISKWTNNQKWVAITHQRSLYGFIVLLFLTASSEDRCYGNVRFAIYSPVFSELTEHDD